MFLPVFSTLFSLDIGGFTFLYLFSFIFYLFYLGYLVLKLIKLKNIKVNFYLLIISFLSLSTFLISIISKNFEISSAMEIGFFNLYNFLIVFYLYLKYIKKNLSLYKILNVIKISLFIISLVFFLSMLFGNYFLTYSFLDQGISGWFIFQNALGHLLIMFLSFLYYDFFKNKDKKILFYILVNIFLMILLGTKASFFFIIIINFLSLIYFIKIKEYFNIKYSLLILLTLLMFYNFFPVSKHIENNIADNTHIVGVALSGRDDAVFDMYDNISNEPLYIKLFGYGVYYPTYKRLYVEMDFFDILYLRGFFGFLFIILFFYKTIKKILYSIKSADLLFLLFLVIPLVIILGLSFFIGHILFINLTLFMFLIFLYYVESEV